MSERVVVSVFDPKTGDTEKAELDPHSYILLTGEFMEVAGYQHWPKSGTVQLTLKRKAPDAR
jgi:hypothetical protein